MQSFARCYVKALAIALAGQGLVATSRAQLSFTEYLIPTPASKPVNICSGPDGNLWYAGEGTNKIGKVTPTGTITEYLIPAGSPYMYSITPGPDGNLWATEFSGQSIWRITTSGSATEFSTPTSGSQPAGITVGPDSNLWFTEYVANKIGKCTPDGVVTEYTIPTWNSGPLGIVPGPDGNLWFTERIAHKIGRITPLGLITEFSVNTSVFLIAAGPDGNLWCTTETADKICKITTSGVIAQYSIPHGFNTVAITPGLDGNMWFTLEGSTNYIGSISTSGALTLFPVPSGGAGVYGITAGPDGNVWFTEYIGNKIGKFSLGPMTKFSGQVFLQDYVGDITSVPITISVRPSRTQPPIFYHTVYLDPWGNFSFYAPTPTSQYLVTASAPHWIKRARRGGTNPQTGSLIPITRIALTNGDVDGTGEVDASDIDAVIMDFGGNGAMTDVDGSGEVDAADIDIVIRNFGAVND